jgi:hypothetical protein
MYGTAIAALKGRGVGGMCIGRRRLFAAFESALACAVFDRASSVCRWVKGRSHSFIA